MVSKPWLSLLKQLLLNTNKSSSTILLKALVNYQRFFIELIARIYCLICGIAFTFSNQYWT